MRSEEEIAADISGTEEVIAESDEDDSPPCKLRVGKAREAIDELLQFTEDCEKKEVQKFYATLHSLSQEIISIQYAAKKQTVIPAFFNFIPNKPASRQKKNLLQRLHRLPIPPRPLRTPQLLSKCLLLFWIFLVTALPLSTWPLLCRLEHWKTLL